MTIILAPYNPELWLAVWHPHGAAGSMKSSKKMMAMTNMAVMSII